MIYGYTWVSLLVKLTLKIRDSPGIFTQPVVLGKIIYENIDNRDFSEWTMGYSDVTKEDLRKIEGLNDFFRSNSSYIDLDKGRAKTLLKAFKDGQWRASIN